MDSVPDHENCESFVPRKFKCIRYYILSAPRPTHPAQIIIGTTVSNGLMCVGLMMKRHVILLICFLQCCHLPDMSSTWQGHYQTCTYINTSTTVFNALYAGVALAASFASAASVWLCLHSGPNCHQCLPQHRAAQRPGKGHTGKQEWQVHMYTL